MVCYREDNEQVDHGTACPCVVVFLLVVVVTHCGILSQGQCAGVPQCGMSLCVGGNGGNDDVIRKGNGEYLYNLIIMRVESRFIHRNSTLL